MNWINVKDRLPEKSGHYLVYVLDTAPTEIDGETFSTSAVYCMEYDADQKIFIDGDWYYNAALERPMYHYTTLTHWMPLPEPPQTDRFSQLRSRLFKMIAKELAEDPHCKNYEGCLEVLAEYPTYFEDNTAESSPNFYRIGLHCYVVGATRHYNFDGETMKDCLDQFEMWLDDNSNESEES